MTTTQLQRERFSRRLHATLWISLIALLPSTIYAECMRDADCGEGEICESAPSSIGECYIDEEGEEVCVEEEIESVGYCQEAPINCEQDSDCPSHLRCASSGGIEPSGSTSTSSSGGGPVPPPEGSEGFEGDDDPDADADPAPEEPEEVPEDDEQMMCVFIPTECSADGDCAENFRCEIFTYAAGCLEPAAVPCEEGEDCPPQDFEDDCEDEEITEGFCVPTEIECDSDDACPADWRCREIVNYECDTDDIAVDSSDSEARDPLPAPEGEAEPVEPGEMEEADELEEPETDVGCEETSRTLCVPIGFGHIDLYEGEVSPASDDSVSTGSIEERDPDSASPSDGDEEGSEALSAEDTDDMDATADIEESSCRASARSMSPWSLFMLLAVLGLRRRLKIIA